MGLKYHSFAVIGSKKLTKWYQIDLGFYASKENILQQHRRIVISSDNWGRLSFYFPHFKDVTFQITTKGKLGIFYPEAISLDECIERVKLLLVRADSNPAQIISDISSEKIEEIKREKPKTSFFDSLKHGREIKRIEKERKRERTSREQLAAKYTYLELIAKFHPELKAFKDWAEIEKKNRKELGLDKEASE